MSTYYALLSGEHETLPLAELRAILEAEGVNYRVVRVLDQLVLFSAEELSPGLITSRASMVKEVGIVLAFNEVSDLDDLVSLANDVDWSFLNGKRFCVRFKHVKRYLGDVATPLAERTLGAVALRHASLARVDLKSPDVVVRGIASEDFVVLGVRLEVLDTRQFHLRRPRSRPFFHPGVLSPKLSRLFVNLSRPRRGGVMLDPFCGSGGFLIECALMGIRCIGSDISEYMVRGALMNVRYYGLDGLVELLSADALRLPYRHVRSISTDPPYGRSTSTMGRSVNEVIEGFLHEAADLVDRGGYIVYATPHDVDAAGMARNAGLEVVEVHNMRVHRSLTRIIVVARRR